MTEEQEQAQAQPEEQVIPPSGTQDADVSVDDAVKAAQEALANAQEALSQVAGAQRPELDDTAPQEPVQETAEGEGAG